LSEATKSALEKVVSEFSIEVAAELEAGRDQALESLEGARRETIETVSKILEGGTKQAESLIRQITGTSELGSRNLQLRVTEEAVSEVFEAAMKKVAKSNPADYEKAIGHLLAEGVEFIGSVAKVSCSAKDKKVVFTSIKKLNHGATKLSLDDESIDTIGGVVLTSADGTVRFDNTFEARLERLRPTLRKDVASLLARGELKPRAKASSDESEDHPSEEDTSKMREEGMPSRPDDDLGESPQEDASESS
jgi:V/A-type H+/Na+-transporting ATPase subunit E